MSTRTNPLTNHAQVRALALHLANDRLAAMKLPRRFTRVSAAFHLEIDAAVRELVRRRSTEHWQKGVTLQ